ncbi:hypothetical protein AAMO2058_000168700 [Amorphochlora amoebiformis]
MKPVTFLLSLFLHSHHPLPHYHPPKPISSLRISSSLLSSHPPPPFKYRGSPFRRKLPSTLYSSLEIWEEGGISKPLQGEGIDWEGGGGEDERQGGWVDALKVERCTWRLRVKGGGEKRFKKRKGESREHVVMKGLLWGLYKGGVLGEGGAVSGSECYVEKRITGQRYLPDCVDVDYDTNTVHWWGEAGKLKESKWISLVDAYPTASFTFVKWGKNLNGIWPSFGLLLSQRLSHRQRRQIKVEREKRAKSRAHSKTDKIQERYVEIISFPFDAATAFISPHGEVLIEEYLRSHDVQSVILGVDGTLLSSRNL